MKKNAIILNISLLISRIKNQNIKQSKLNDQKIIHPSSVFTIFPK